MILSILFIVFMVIALAGIFSNGPVPIYVPLFLWLSLALLGYRVLNGHLF